MNIATQTAQIGLEWDTRTGAVTVPIYQTATFRHPGLGQSTGYDYTRSGNPTRQALEEGIARLEGGARGFAYASGMAAIANLLLLFKKGDHLVVTEDLYGGTCRLFDQIFTQYELSFTYVDTSDIKAVRAAIRPETKALFVESLTNPLLKVADIAALSALCRERGLLHIVDNTFLTPYLLRPFDHGADITVYSATKYLAGHNDTVSGLVAVKDPQLAERVYFLQNSVGAVLGPQDSWLTIRGMKTLSVRLDRQQENAGRVAQWLSNHPRVRKVYYPGLSGHPGHPGHELLARQARGFGAMIAFEVDEHALVERLLLKTEVISFAESLGGVETLITFPQVQTHADIPPELRQRLGINDVLLRLSVGIEDADDLIDDLAQAFEGGDQGSGTGDR
ncbi:Cys/Met metabolism pyridoxal-phosphate-dependent protein [Geobacter metallireducens RCH3]|uniref:Cystathionine gamma-synthase/beta-lyase n=1 Tax=Geobacter metallireducens (strain ATCC 53774 / DSM 7210 / GS-15) TaxID=269799 RepID=Q39XT4_GEOMG|nr:PLP-dependent aspartate aminotransferase family protein [Geobacter metallireducens]ABB30940.1 cystathionine gamma-synthase/beta-lyase [Geobacter metallireducens GS-15]EHP85103.1 Cys/Met metabolism pyridoxal-phosphate-dependent protein [Geobacter metallireducens RCH3]